jgi:hypothetical protein
MGTANAGLPLVLEIFSFSDFIATMFAVCLLGPNSSNARAKKVLGTIKGETSFSSSVEAVKVLTLAAESTLYRKNPTGTTQFSDSTIVSKEERPDTSTTGIALLLLERLCKLEKARCELEQEERLSETKIQGSWRLIYTIGKPAQKALLERMQKGSQESGFRAGMYFPLEARIQFSSESKSPGQLRMITNEAYVLFHSLGIQFAGPCAFQKQQSRLLFDFCEWRLQMLGLWSPSIQYKKWEPRLEELNLHQRRRLPFFTFFYTDAFILAGRGRGGGLALWAKEEELT